MKKLNIQCVHKSELIFLKSLGRLKQNECETTLNHDKFFVFALLPNLFFLYENFCELSLNVQQITCVNTFLIIMKKPTGQSDNPSIM